MKILLTLLISLWACSNISAQVQPFYSADQQALGGILLTQNDVWSGINNPSLLCKTPSKQLATYVHFPYSIKELSTASIGARTPWRKVSGIGFGYRFSGYAVSNAQSLYLGYGHQLSDQMGAGMALAYSNSSIAGETALQNLALILGAHYNLNHATRLSARFSSGPSKSTPADYRMGLLWEAGSYAEVHMEMAHEFGNTMSFQLGCLFEPKENISIHIGAGLNPTRLGFGVKFQLTRLQISLASAKHNLLGFSPVINAQFSKP